jgi:hypothetical protein
MMPAPLLLLVCGSLLTTTGCSSIESHFGGAKTPFDAKAAMGYVKTQLDFGPRVPGTPAHEREGDWIVAQMKQRTDSVIVQSWTHTTLDGKALPMRNVLARFNPAATDRVLYVTHWDTRPVADSDPVLGNRTTPIPGANDGASGVALFIALGDALQKTPPSVGVDLLFVDGEDWGNFDTDSSGKLLPDVLIGSTYFASHLPSPGYKPLYGVLWDMIGDRDLQIYQEGNSVQAAPEVVSRVWETAANLGYSKYFLQQPGLTITDDHVPLLDAGLRVIDVIDMQYGPLAPGYGPETLSNPNYHHTLQDTYDKVSAKSLQVVGDVALSLVK